MNRIGEIKELLALSHAEAIARRYFITNGFDGALAMLGLCIGINTSGEIEPVIAAKACIGTGLALGVSGLTSAYISEAAERQKTLRDIEQAMLTTLDNTKQAYVAKLVPYSIALVNGLAPLVIAVLVTIPLWLSAYDIWLPLHPLWFAVSVALTIVFFLGVFLARLSSTFWLWGGVKALGAALLTLFLVMLL